MQIEHLVVKDEMASFYRGFEHGQHMLFGVNYDIPKEGQTTMTMWLILIVGESQNHVDYLLNNGGKMKKKDYFTSNGHDLWTSWKWALSILHDVEVLAARIADEYGIEDLYITASSEDKRRDRIYMNRLPRYGYPHTVYTYKKKPLGFMRRNYTRDHPSKHIQIKENDHE